MTLMHAILAAMHQAVGFFLLKSYKDGLALSGNPLLGHYGMGPRLNEC